jgi:hypothetical protein
MKIEVKCDNCGVNFLKEKSTISNNVFCCVKCKNIYFTGKPNEKISKALKGKFLGEKNPNFGNKWTDEKKKHFSDKIKSKVDDIFRENCSKGMRGKKVSDETKEKSKKTKLERYGTLRSMTGHTEETKLLIGKKSKEKFTLEYKKKQYNIMVERGVWIPKEEKKPYIYYRELSNWNYNVLNYPIDGIDKFKILGYYNRNNKNGVVRDHMFSRRSGFEQQVFPEILRHPSNCKLITHKENISKQQNKKIKSDSITLDELFNRIENFNFDYDEQIICIEKIKKYKNGERYEKYDYIEKFA